ncbi:hypothetical protein ABTG33_18375, partial [Acinetobacter baumannii]
GRHRKCRGIRGVAHDDYVYPYAGQRHPGLARWQATVHRSNTDLRQYPNRIGGSQRRWQEPAWPTPRWPAVAKQRHVPALWPCPSCRSTGDR